MTPTSDTWVIMVDIAGAGGAVRSRPMYTMASESEARDEVSALKSEEHIPGIRGYWHAQVPAR